MILTTEEKQTLLKAINIAIKASDNALEAAQVLLPIALKFTDTKSAEAPDVPPA